MLSVATHTETAGFTLFGWAVVRRNGYHKPNTATSNQSADRYRPPASANQRSILTAACSIPKLRLSNLTPPK